MLSSSLSQANPPPSPFSSKPHQTHHFSFTSLSLKRTIPPLSATKLPFTPPPPSPPGELYQPFRPPPSSHLPPKYRSLPPTEKLNILRDRLGLWHEYAPLISSLSREGFTPPSIEEATGLTGVEQNRLIVGSQVRLSLLSSPSFSPELLPYFDAGSGAELLYELRLLSNAQRAAAAALLIDRRLDPRGARELARAIKDFPRRRGDPGWASFSSDSPADCLAYTHFRLSREVLNKADRVAELEKALEDVETEKARTRILQEMEKVKKGEGEGDKEEEEEKRAVVPVVRLRYGEVAEASSVVLLPVVRAVEGARGVAAAPGRCKPEGELGVVSAGKEWARWAVVPGWAPVMEAAEAVAVEMDSGRGLPWRSLVAAEEKILVVADRGRREVRGGDQGGVFLVEREGRLMVERERRLRELGVEQAAAMVVLVVRPPMEDDDQLSDEDWE